jgi:predicted alpha/beta hydrolase family esterase
MYLHCNQQVTELREEKAIHAVSRNPKQKKPKHTQEKWKKKQVQMTGVTQREMDQRAQDVWVEKACKRPLSYTR